MALLKRKTVRLVIRPLELKDYPVWKSAYKNLLPAQNIHDFVVPESHDTSLKKFKKVLQNQKKSQVSDKMYSLAVFNKKQNLLLGKINFLVTLRNFSQNAIIGYIIFNNHWGQGFGKEAVSAALNIAFKDIKLHRVEAGIEPSNKRSLRLIKSLGFRKEGLEKRTLYLRKQWVDLLKFAVTSEDLEIKWTWSKRPTPIR